MFLKDLTDYVTIRQVLQFTSVTNTIPNHLFDPTARRLLTPFEETPQYIFLLFQAHCEVEVALIFSDYKPKSEPLK